MKNSKKKQRKIIDNQLVDLAKSLWKNGDRKRKCPKCEATVEYKDKWSYIYAYQDNNMCKTCTCRDNAIKYDYKSKFSGKNNPFYGKHHTNKKRFGIQNIGKQTGDSNPMRRLEIRKYFSKLFSGPNNPMYGKMVSEETRKKLSLSNKGKNNPMYGKPSPNGSGNGWASWYKGKHFRSLRELQYYITEIEPNSRLCENGQQSRFKSEYKNYDGTERTYHPDFFVDGKYLIEIKPKAMWQTPLVMLKKKAAEKLCKKMGWEYKLIDIQPNSAILKDKYLNGEIRFVEKYKERFEKYAGIK